MKQAQLLKVQVNGEVKTVAVAEIKIISPFASSDYMYLKNEKNQLVAEITSKEYCNRKTFMELRTKIKQAIKNKTVLIANGFNIAIESSNNYVLFENRVLSSCEFVSYCERYNVNNMSDVKKAMIKKYFGTFEKQLKKFDKKIKINFDFEKYGDLRIERVNTIRKVDFVKTLAVISYSDIKQLSYTIDDFVFDNIDKIAKQMHELKVEF